MVNNVYQPIFKFMGILKKDMQDIEIEETNEKLYKKRSINKNQISSSIGRKVLGR